MLKAQSLVLNKVSASKIFASRWNSNVVSMTTPQSYLHRYYCQEFTTDNMRQGVEIAQAQKLL